MSEIPVTDFWQRFTAIASATDRGGVWVAFNWDGSSFVPFASELDAYRYASSYGMPVKFARFGDDGWMLRSEVVEDGA